MNATEMSKVLDANPNNRAISTWTGHAFDLFDRSTWKFSREDIARSLSNQCRFLGHIEPRSVAQHSLQVANELEYLFGVRPALLGLLHDASEAYLCDIPRPWKGEVSIGNRSYYEVEEELQLAIFEWAGVLDLYHGEAWNWVKEADIRSYKWEVERRGTGNFMREKQDAVMDRFLRRWDRLSPPEPKPLPKPKHEQARMARAMRYGLPIDPTKRCAPGMEKVQCVSTPSRMWGTNGK